MDNITILRRVRQHIKETHGALEAETTQITEIKRIKRGELDVWHISAIRFRQAGTFRRKYVYSEWAGGEYHEVEDML